MKSLNPETLLRKLPIINFALVMILLSLVLFLLFLAFKKPLPDIKTTPVVIVPVTSIIPEDSKANFDLAVKFVLENEGGYSNNRDDHGGATKFGIATKFHPGIDVTTLTREQAIQIYKDRYWDTTQIPFIVNPNLRIKIFDASVLIGYGAATKAIQRALKCTGLEVQVDGVFGKKTLQNINDCVDQIGLQWAFIAEFSHYLEEVAEEKPEEQKFLVGWLNRAYDVVKE